jgi:CheY-like chemotaxis protein
MWHVLLVEDNEGLCEAMRYGLEATGKVAVLASAAHGEDALDLSLEERPDVVLMDVQLAGEMNGIEAAIALRREYPRLPVVFYSIQDDDAYYRSFLHSGILSHYAYVRKSNYLLPKSIVPLLREEGLRSPGQRPVRNQRHYLPHRKRREYLRGKERRLGRYVHGPDTARRIDNGHAKRGLRSRNRILYRQADRDGTR